MSPHFFFIVSGAISFILSLFPLLFLFLHFLFIFSSLFLGKEQEKNWKFSFFFSSPKRKERRKKKKKCKEELKKKGIFEGKMKVSLPFFLSDQEMELEKKSETQGHFEYKKDPASSNDETRSFYFLFFFISFNPIKKIAFGRIKGKWENTLGHSHSLLKNKS